MSENNTVKTFTILVVEDMPDNIGILYQILKDDYKVLVAKSGKKALDVISSGETLPDLILLDVMMPEMDGYEVCRVLKSDTKTKDIPIIFLTAKSEIDDLVKGFQLGAVDYVTKPYNTTELLTRVSTHLELKKSKEELQRLYDELRLINVELTNTSELSDSKVDYLIKRISLITSNNKDVHEHIKMVKKLIPLIAINDLGNLKVVMNILEGSQCIVDRIVKEASPEEDYFRLLSASIEPLKTAVSNIEVVIRVLISIGLISAASIEDMKIDKTAFYESLDNMLQSGKLSHENFNKLLELSKFHLNSDEDDSVFLFRSS